MSDDKPPYEVGYGKPPTAHQFKPGGPSPNPKGRPRKNGPYQDAVRRALDRKITVTTGNKRRRVSVTDLTLEQLGNLAAKGNLKAIVQVMKLGEKMSPLKPESPISAEELQFRREAAAKLSGYIIAGLEAEAARTKPERPRGVIPPTTPLKDGEPA